MNINTYMNKENSKITTITSDASTNEMDFNPIYFYHDPEIEFIKTTTFTFKENLDHGLDYSSDRLKRKSLESDILNKKVKITNISEMNTVGLKRKSYNIEVNIVKQGNTVKRKSGGKMRKQKTKK